MGAFSRRALAGVLVLGAALTGCDNERGGDVPRIRATLAAIPGVRVLDVVGWDSIWPLFGPIDIRADLEIRNGGRLVLCDLTPEAFAGNNKFLVARVGRWAPYVEREKGELRYVAGCPASVDIAPGSPFLELVPFKLRSVRDVVDHYGELERMIQSWPAKPVRVAAADGRGWIEYRKEAL